MVTPELMESLFQYNLWADRRVTGCCGSLTNEEFTRNLNSSFGSVRDTLVHLYGAAFVWNERIQGRTPTAFPNPADFPDLDSIRRKLEEMDLYLLDSVSKMTQQDLDRVMRYKTASGAEFSNPLWQSLHQVTNHASYHRGQVVTMLRQLDAKPLSTDLIGFYREQAAAARA